VRGPARVTGTALAVLGLVAGVTGCVSPALNGGQYAGKATLAVEAASSEVATGALVVEDDLAGKVLETYADRVVTSSESTMGSITAAFGSVQPPSPADDALRDAVLEALSDGEDALAHARIAVRRSDDTALAAALAELRASQKALEQLEEQLP
jgi:hypothetical protein